MPIVRDDEVIQFIDSGASPYKLAKYTGSVERALLAYADVMGDRYSSQKMIRGCCVCSSEIEPHRLVMTWSAPARGDRTANPLVTILIAAMGHVHVGELTRIRFCTHHTLCARCERSYNWKVSLAPFWGVLAALVIAVGALGMVLAVLGWVVQPRAKDLPVFGLAAAVGLLVTLIGLWAWRGYARLSVPRSLRTIKRAPFVLDEIESDRLQEEVD
jgi:hypothetical protein